MAATAWLFRRLQGTLRALIRGRPACLSILPRWVWNGFQPMVGQTGGPRRDGWTAGRLDDWTTGRLTSRVLPTTAKKKNQRSMG